MLREDGPAVPELRQAVLEWRIKFSDASRIVKQPAEVQRQAVERKLNGQVRTVRAGVREIEAEMRDRADTEGAEAVHSLPMDDTLRVVCSQLEELNQVVDPEQRGPDRHFSADRGRMGGEVWRAGRIRPSRAGSRWSDGGDGEPGLSAADSQADGGAGSGMDRRVGLPPTGPACPHGAPHRAVKSRRPVLLYGKPGCILPEGSDVIEKPHRGESPNRKDTELLLEGMEALVRRLARPGQLVCDPVMLGRETVALSARRHGCRFVGAAETDSLISRILVRLAQAKEG